MSDHEPDVFDQLITARDEELAEADALGEEHPTYTSKLGWSKLWDAAQAEIAMLRKQLNDCSRAVRWPQ